MEKIKKEIRLPEEELKEFIKNLYNIEAETRIKTQEKMIEDLNKIINKKEIENKKLKEKVENLEKKGKALKEDLGKKEKEIKRKDIQLEELERKLEKEIEINKELNEEIGQLKEERAKILLQQLPLDAKFEIEKEIENLRKSIQEKERYISSLEAARKEEREILKANINNLEKQLEEKERIIKEKEKEIENLRKEEIKVYERLTKENLDTLEGQLKELSYAKDKGESLTVLKTIGDKILKIYKKIYFFLDENGLTTEVEDNLLRDLWSFTKDYLKPESTQADDVIKQKITQIIAQCEYFKNSIQANKEIEKMLSHL
jgi:chromosome segregation ATPase